jgi:hypothetical protein
MCKEIDKNERLLRKTVYKLETFTESKLCDELLRIDSKALLLKPFWSVKRYLEELRDIGLLTYEDGNYSTKNKIQKKRHRMCVCS